MYCKRNKGTLSIGSCIKRQTLIQEYFELTGEIKKQKTIDTDISTCTLSKFRDLDISRLEKCYECKQGQTVKECPDRNLDKDVRDIIYINYTFPKPKRYELKIKEKKIWQKKKTNRLSLQMKPRRLHLKKLKKL